jgi:Tfp pilus assembly protein PilN
MCPFEHALQRCRGDIEAIHATMKAVDDPHELPLFESELETLKQREKELEDIVQQDIRRAHAQLLLDVAELISKS